MAQLPPPPTPTIFNNIVLSLLNLQILDGLQPSIIYCQLGSIDKKLHAKKTVGHTKQLLAIKPKGVGEGRDRNLFFR